MYIADVQITVEYKLHVKLPVRYYGEFMRLKILYQRLCSEIRAPP